MIRPPDRTEPSSSRTSYKTRHLDRRRRFCRRSGETPVFRLCFCPYFAFAFACILPLPALLLVIPQRSGGICIYHCSRLFRIEGIAEINRALVFRQDLTNPYDLSS
jgi:hypothetical protein